MNLKRLTKGVALVIAVSMAAGIGLAHACSRVLWVRDGQPVLVGPMDWFEPMRTNLWALPRGIEHDGLAGKNSLHWTSKYGSVVSVVYGFASADGMNEKGLDQRPMAGRSRLWQPRQQLPGLSMSLGPNTISITLGQWLKRSRPRRRGASSLCQSRWGSKRKCPRRCICRRQHRRLGDYRICRRQG